MKEETLMEIGSLKLVEAIYSESTYKEISFELTVPMPGPFRDEFMEFGIDKDEAKELIGWLERHFNLSEE